jgi:endonuclease-3
MLRRIEKATASFPKAAMFGLKEEGYTSLFQQLVSCVISIRSLDETTYPLSRQLLEKAGTPAQMLRLKMEEIADILYGTTYPGQKAETILRIASRAMEYPGAILPAEYDVLTSIKGIGPKCANLALGVAAGVEKISVDVHVHRVVNRWGLVATKTPEQTLEALEDILAKKYWTDINRLLIPFGKHICTLRLPHCSTCPVLKWCMRVGVTKSR